MLNQNDTGLEDFVMGAIKDMSSELDAEITIDDDLAEFMKGLQKDGGDLDLSSMAKMFAQVMGGGAG